MAKVLSSREMNKCIGCFACQRVCATVNEKSFTDNKSAIRIRSLGGINSRYVAIHCHACVGDRPCMDSCPTHALEKRQGGGVILNRELCVGCRRCEKACIVGAVNFLPDVNHPVICRHCGVCVRYCPHKCLNLEEVPDAE